MVDLLRWYDETKIRKLEYSNDILSCTESDNNILNEDIANKKSPIYWQTPKQKLNYASLDIYTGVYDGMIGNGPIPITHSINFYNKLLNDIGEKDKNKYVSDKEKLFLLEYRKSLGSFGSISGRKVFLFKESNNIRLTLFDGGHEILKEFAFQQLIK